MMKRFFYHSILSLFLLVMFCITGGGNLAKAQSYQLVRSTAGLVSGDKYLIVAKGYNKALGGINPTSGNNRTAVAVTFATNTKDNISTLPDGACELELQAQDNGTWAFYDALNKGYLYAASKSENHLKTKDTLDDNGKATVTITTASVATIKFTGTNTRNLLRYNPNTGGSPLFSCYSSGQKDVYLYHYVESSATALLTPNFLTIQLLLLFCPAILLVGLHLRLLQKSLETFLLYLLLTVQAMRMLPQ